MKYAKILLICILGSEEKQTEQNDMECNCQLPEGRANSFGAAAMCCINHSLCWPSDYYCCTSYFMHQLTRHRSHWTHKDICRTRRSGKSETQLSIGFRVLPQTFYLIVPPFSLIHWQPWFGRSIRNHFHQLVWLIFSF